jgi:hypothetical protein
MTTAKASYEPTEIPELTETQMVEAAKQAEEQKKAPLVIPAPPPMNIPTKRFDSGKTLAETVQTVTQLSERPEQWNNTREAVKWEFQFQTALKDKAREAQTNVDNLKGQRMGLMGQINLVKENIMFLEDLQHRREAPANRVKPGSVEEARSIHEQKTLNGQRLGLKNLESNLGRLDIAIDDHSNALDFFTRALVRIVLEDKPERPEDNAGIVTPPQNMEAFE